MLRKISAILIIVMILAINIPPQKAHAIVPAIAVGAEVGLGAYILGAYAVAEVVGVLGYGVYSDEINQYARTTFQDANQTIKDSLLASWRTALDAGSQTITLTQDVIDFLKTKISVGAKNAIVSAAVQSNALPNGVTFNYFDSGSYKSYWLANGVTTQTLYIGGVPQTTASRGSLFIYEPVASGNRYGVTIENALPATIHYDHYGTSLGIPYSGNAGVAFVYPIMERLFGGVKVLPSAITAPVDINLTAMQNDVFTQIATINPSDLVAYPKKDLVLDKTKKLAYDPAIGKYSDSAGSIYDPPGVGLDYPKIKVETDTATGTKTLTAEIGTNITNVKTGVITGTIAVPVTAVGTGKPPTFNDPSGNYPKPNIMMLMLDFFRCIIEYLVKLATFLLTLGAIPSQPLTNSGMQMLMNKTFDNNSLWGQIFPFAININVTLLMLLQNLVSFAMGFAVYRVIRRYLGGSS